MQDGNLFLPVPDTDFRDLVEETRKLSELHPEILSSIEADQDAHALKKKELRLADKKFIAEQTSPLPQLDLQTDNPVRAPGLEQGRPRLPAESLLIFMMIRGYLGSVSDQKAYMFLCESMSLNDFLHNRGLQLPGKSTLVENLNLLSEQTLEKIHRAQLTMALGENLDDFRELTIDSTSVRANSSWPTDGKMMLGLLERVFRMGEELKKFGLPGFRAGHVPRWFKEMEKIEFRICLNAGKAHSKRKMKKGYGKLLDKAQKALRALKIEWERCNEALNLLDYAPSRRKRLELICEQIQADLTDVERVIEYCRERIFENKTCPSKEKVLSLSDDTAAFIKKGGREPVIGYKPQLVRSRQGFVSGLQVPEGNAADSAEFAPCVEMAMERSGVIADLVSGDDGYATSKGRDTLMEMGVGTVSISGAKGKKQTREEDWESEEHKEARANRSAVESLMFTLKYSHRFGRVERRGIEAVRQELWEKVLAYNLCRMIHLRKKKEKERSWAA
jgi:IS5 family transposase